MPRRPLVFASLLLTQTVACGGDDGSQIDTDGAAETGSGAESENPATSGAAETTDGSSADETTGDSDPSGDPDDTGEVPTCEAVAFGTASTWALPDLSALPTTETADLLEQVAGGWGCTNDESLRTTTMDLTGDGRLDLVITDGCDAAGVGTERWIVHPGEDGGFGGATTWTLPDLSALPTTDTSDLLEQVAGGWGCTNDEALQMTTMDLTGDGQLDLVITDGCDAAGVGTERWIVHPGEDGGFGGATTWTLPDLSALPTTETSDLLERVAGGWGCTNDEALQMTTMDLTGDGRLDLVITDGCDAAGVGTERWIVHPGQDGGFGGATTWTLPDLSALPTTETSDLLEQVAGGWGCTNEEELRMTTMDITGDGWVDLVITDGCDAAGVGTERWIVHPGEEGGFGAATTWTLPDLSALPTADTGDLLEQSAGGWSCTNEEELRLTTMDITGDGLLDVVITDGCDPAGVGTERWIVHPGEDGGFGAATPWALPDLSALPTTETADLLEQLAGGWGCNNDETLRLTTMDITGDGLVDLLISDGCDAAGVGTERWIVHPGECE